MINEIFHGSTSKMKWPLCLYQNFISMFTHTSGTFKLNLGVFFDAGGHDFVIPDALPLLLFFKCNVN